MKRFFGKLFILFLIPGLVMMAIGIYSDPASLYSSKLIEDMENELRTGNVISNGNTIIDERLFQELRISNLPYDPQTIVMGSSRVMYVPWEEDGLYNAGVSSATLKDYYGIVGILDSKDIKYNKIIFGIDPWIFSNNENGVEYKSIIPYIIYEESICKGDTEAKVQQGFLNRNWEYDYERFITLFSPAYFKSALKNIRNVKNKYVKKENNEDVSDVWKIVPSGRRIPRHALFHTVEQNDMTSYENIAASNLYYISNFRELDNNKTRCFEALITHLIQKGIEIEFYLPAWYPIQYDAIAEDEQYSGVNKCEKYLIEYASKHGITVRGSYNPYICNLNKEDFMDDLHLKPEKALEQYYYIREEGQQT